MNDNTRETDMAIALSDVATERELTFDYIPVDRLKVDRKYQRGVQPQRVAKIANEWDDFSASALTVSLVGRDYWVIDGQHRLEAARLRGMDALPCLIYPALTPAHQARLFVALNRDRVKPHPVELFKASLAQGDPAAHELNQIINRLGLKIELGAGNFQAVTTGLTLLQRFGRTAFSAIMATLVTAWENDPTGATDFQIIKAVAAMYSHYSATAIDWDVLRATLRNTTRQELRNVGRARKAGGWRESAVLALVITEAYNRQAPRSSRLRVPSTAAVFSRALSGYRHSDVPE